MNIHVKKTYYHIPIQTQHNKDMENRRARCINGRLEGVGRADGRVLAEQMGVWSQTVHCSSNVINMYSDQIISKRD